MRKAFARVVDVAAPAQRLLHRVVDFASALGAARRALAGNGTKQLARGARFRRFDGFPSTC